MFWDFGKDEDLFDDYVEDFIEDIGYIAKKYEFSKLVGRPRQWREDFVVKIRKQTCEEFLFSSLLNENQIKFVFDEPAKKELLFRVWQEQEKRNCYCTKLKNYIYHQTKIKSFLHVITKFCR